MRKRRKVTSVHRKAMQKHNRKFVVGGADHRGGQTSNRALRFRSHVSAPL